MPQVTQGILTQLRLSCNSPQSQPSILLIALYWMAGDFLILKIPTILNFDHPVHFTLFQ